MRPAIFLRMAAGFTILEAVLHTIGGVFGKPLPGPATVAVVAMKANHFQVFGVSRSYWDFYFGFGLAISVFLAVEGLVFWFLGNLAAESGTKLRPVLGLFFVGYLALAADAFRFFFFGPLVCDVLVAACLAFAFFGLRKETAVSL